MLSIGPANHRHQVVPVPHHVFNGTRGWMQTAVEPHPVVMLTVSTDESDYSHLRLPCPTMRPTKCAVIAGSGCQSSLLGLKVFSRFGLKKSSLVPVKGKMSAINGEGINILGAVFIRLTGTAADGQTVQTAVITHVTESTERFYISHQAMRELGIISQDFPKVQARTVNAATFESEFAPCSWSRNCLPLERPDFLPLATMEQNVDKMKSWLLDRFSSSTFIRCPQALLLMKGEPIKIHIDPKSVYTAATVPIHWCDEVQAQLNQDVARASSSRCHPASPLHGRHGCTW